MENIDDGKCADPVVEDATACPDDVALVDRVRRRQSGRDVVVVAERIRPVVAEAQRYRQARANLPIVLHVCADLFVQECQLPVALLLREGVRSAGRI